jgi:hypothetical protein
MTTARIEWTTAEGKAAFAISLQHLDYFTSNSTKLAENGLHAKVYAYSHNE